MSKKITAMTEVTTLESTDWVTGIDNSAADASKNVKITKANLQAGLATVGSVTGVAQDLASHESSTGNSAHTGMALQSDIDTHAGGLNGTTAHVSSANRAAWDAKVDIGDLGGAAFLDVGTLSGDVAAGDAPANAVTGHESTYDHTDIPTANQKAGLDGNAGSGVDPYAVESQIITDHSGLTGLDTLGAHLGSSIQISGGVANNAVAIAADGSLVDSGEPPGGVTESTRTKVSVTDSVNDYLEAKIVAGADITVTKNGADATNQTLVIAYNGSAGGIPDAPDANNYVRTLGDWNLADAAAVGALPDNTSLGTDSGELTGGGTLSSGLSLGLAFAATATGDFTNANITVDGFGRVTAVESGSNAAAPTQRFNHNATVSGDVPILLDGRSINVNINDGVAADLTFSTAGDDFNQENTCSFDLVFAGSGTVSIPGEVEQMGTFGVITGTAGAIVTCVARSRQNGTIQLYRSAKVTS